MAVRCGLTQCVRCTCIGEEPTIHVIKIQVDASKVKIRSIPKRDLYEITALWMRTPVVRKVPV